MSPEQKAGEPATAASDIYSLALVLKEAGCPKHAISARMRAPDPQRRPTAKDVERHLASLEMPAYTRLVSALAILLVLVGMGGAYWLRRSRQLAPPHLEKITEYSGGHDVTAAPFRTTVTSLRTRRAMADSFYAITKRRSFGG